MKRIYRSVLVNYSPEQMFNLVKDVENYPQFLPWCSHTRVLENNIDGMIAEVGMKLGALHKSFTTKNFHENKNKITIKLLKGPFSCLEGHWTFQKINEDNIDCRIQLNLIYGFENRILASLIGSFFDKIAQNLMESFISRAKVIYG